MTDLHEQILGYLAARPGRTDADIGEELGCGQVVAHGILMQLKDKGKAYDVRGMGARYWYRASWGGYSPRGAA